MQPQVSFIVIARNQAATVAASLDSAFRAARSARLLSFEVIYVDSNSSDGSVQMVQKRFGGTVNIMGLTGAMNAGIARNVGASVAKGNVLFFIDGDMEISPDFLREVLDEHNGLLHPLVTGQLPEKLYDAGGKPIGDAPDRYRIRTRHFRPELGGVFLIDRTLFRSSGGFASELRCNEDLDLGLRLARAGTLALAIPRPIATHHTVEYLEWARLIPMIRTGSLFYPGVLFRRHITNRFYLPILISHQRSTGVLMACVALAAFVHPTCLLLYVAYVGVKHLRRSNTTFPRDLAGTTARSVCFLLGVLGYFPRRIPAEAVTVSPSGGSD